ncbi:MAG TPA: M81 family metallopeptidase [Fimbriiglobus sp.]|jgi:microcystin degradation protein MlrC|nr:M81 family metallopeptidase [Fimbriiglobus sp.]
MRVGIIAFLQESNTFLAGRTALADFERDVLCEGEEVRRRFGRAHHEVGGFFDGMADAAIEAVPVFAARALPYGVIASDTFDELMRRMLAALDRAGPLDGLLVAPHGATVAENAPDADGHWLAAVRDRVGSKIPIIGTLDLHANLSPKMVAACNALIPYRTNPHLDQRERGLEAANLMVRTLIGDIQPVMAAEYLPLAVNIERQATGEQPLRELYAAAAVRLTWPGLFCLSPILGFPYADVPEMGAAVIAVAGNPGWAAQNAASLANWWWGMRADYRGHLVGVEDAVEQASQLDGPVCLLDMGDNVGGGSPGDGTLIAHELHRQRLGPSCVVLADPESQGDACVAGAGNRVRLRVGGKTDALHGEPLDAEFTVRGFSDGKFSEPNPRHGGFASFDQGQTAVVETDTGLTVVLTNNRMAPFSLNQLTSCGLDPGRFRVLVAKGVHAPVAAYAPVCRHLIRVDTPGVTSADLARLTYRHRRRPMFPFEPEMAWSPATGGGSDKLEAPRPSDRV